MSYYFWLGADAEDQSEFTASLLASYKFAHVDSIINLDEHYGHDD